VVKKAAGRRADEGVSSRVRVAGKFLARGERKVYVRGVTYGTFAPGPDGSGYPHPYTVERDFEEMAARSINAVRTYTVPPRRLLDAAQRHGLMVMVGLAWEQHVAFLDHAGRAADIERRVREGVRACAGHPAVLAYAIGNEIPGPVARWHGKRRIERFLRRLYEAAKAEDPDGLVTYVNYPPTEYLELPFLDFVCFNVYLEQRERLDAYLARLHNLAGDRPLVMAEIGLDSRRNGTDVQAESLDWQVRTAFAGGCSGTFVFAWTDRWYITYLGQDGRGQGGSEMTDWDFGLTDRDRRPKPALEAVRRAYQDVPFPAGAAWPPISVVVCSYNGAATVDETCRHVRALDYPDYEVIVVDDGSTDATPQIARRHGFQVISTENRGLSAARNLGAEVATGEIVAYLDDDAYPDRDWLKYLAHAYAGGEFAGVGGPNISPEEDGALATCIACGPGNPTHVLLSDRAAEHIPGCNCSFRRDALLGVGGFDPQFRVAGDDVDLCWRLREAGWKLGFSPAAMVWHHRRGSLRTYWRQQRGYGRAEALLERKWPHKYNGVGHTTWRGRLYGPALPHGLVRRARIYHGTWGIALFQSLYEREPRAVGSLPLMPESYLGLALLGAFSALGLIWRPLLVAAPLLALALLVQLAYAAAAGATASRTRPRCGCLRWPHRALVALLYLVQPLARLMGRVRHGLTPWRSAPRASLSWPLPATHLVWSERWRSPESRLSALEQSLRAAGVSVLSGREFDRWDLAVRGSALALTRIRMGIEEHGAGRQLVRFRVLPRPSHAALSLLVIFLFAAVLSASDGAVLAAATLAAAAAAVLLTAGLEAAAEAGTVASTIHGDPTRDEREPEPVSHGPELDGVTAIQEELAADPA
jgi:O-antigen biosynthesis protein